MKKFYKVSLITAGILAAVGLGLCIFFGFMGGYRWRQRVTSEAVVSYMEELSNRLGFKISFGEGNGIYIGALGKNSTGAAGELMVNGESIAEKGTVYEIPVSEVQELNAKLGAGLFEIREKEESSDTISLTFDASGVWEYALENGTLSVGMKEESIYALWGLKQNEGARCVIGIPKDFTFRTFTATLGAGKLQIEGIKAQEMTLKAGAGQLELADLMIEDFKLKVGAGQAVCENVTSRNAVMDIAMGECRYSGKIDKNLSVDCGQGNVEIAVEGEEADHNYDLDCGMGSIRVGSMRAAGMGAQQTQDNQADSLYQVKCGMGNVTITFK